MISLKSQDAWDLIAKIFLKEEENNDNPSLEGIDEPFRGLESFSSMHAPLFFGRDKDTEDLSAMIQKHGFVVLTGPSGAGKSSLIQAGVIPRMSGDRFLWMRPGNAPMQALRQTLSGVIQSEDLDQAMRDPQKLLTLLQTKARTDGQRIILSVDQAEELLTLCDDADVRREFSETIAVLGGDADNVHVLCSLRSDFLGPMAELEPLRQIFTRNVKVISTPKAELLPATLYGPVKKFGYRFESRQLIDEMIEGVEGEAAALPLLQFCARKMWERRDRVQQVLTRKSLEDLGGVAGALSGHAEEIHESLPPSLQQVFRRLMLRLITPEGTREIRPRTELSGLKNAEQVLNRLIDARLLVSREDENQNAEIEISHEALIGKWPRLQDWLTQAREGQRTLISLRRAAGEWQSRRKARSLLWQDELLTELRRFRRGSDMELTPLELEFAESSEKYDRRNVLVRRSATGGVILILAVFGIFMFTQWKQANIAKEKAEASEAISKKESRRSEVSILEALSRLKGSEGDTNAAVALARAGVRLSAEISQKRKHLNLVYKHHLLGDGHKKLQEYKPGKYSAFASHNISLAISPDGKTIATTSNDEFAILWDTKTGEVKKRLEGHKKRIKKLVFSPDGQTIATGSEDKKIIIWDVQTGNIRQKLEGHRNEVWHLSFSPDGKTIASNNGPSATFDSGTILWDVQTGQITQRLQGQIRSVLDLAWTPDGKALITASSDNTATLWDTQNGKQIFKLNGHQDSIYAISISPDGKMFATASRDNTAILWDAQTGEATHQLQGHESGISDISFSPDGKTVATASWDNTAILWNAQSGEIKKRLNAHVESLIKLEFSPDGKTLATGSRDNSVILWDTQSGEVKKQLTGHGGSVFELVFTSDGKTLATGAAKGSIILWDMENTEPKKKFEHLVNGGTAAGAEPLAISSDGKTIATAYPDNTAILWDAKSGEVRKKLIGHEDLVTKLEFSPDGKTLATGSSDKTVMLWNAQSGESRQRLVGHTGLVLDLQFAPDGKTIATVSKDTTAILWDTNDGQIKAELEGHFDWVGEVSFSPDGKTVATSSADKTAILWDAKSGQIKTTLKGHQGTILGISFSPDGKTVATASGDNSAILWDTKSGEIRKRLEGHGETVYKLAFSPDGKTLATTSYDKTAILWDTDSGTVKKKLDGHDSGVMSIAFTADGGTLATASHKTVRLWDPHTGESKTTLDEPEYHLSLLRFSKDTKKLLTAESNGNAILWNLPPSDPEQLLKETGARTNARVCKNTYKVVNVMPFPKDDEVWAQEEFCK